MHHHYRFFFFFFFNDTATTEIYTLSLHDALPISKFASIMPFQNLRHFSSSGRGIDVQDHEEFFSSQSPQPRKASGLRVVLSAGHLNATNIASQERLHT